MSHIMDCIQAEMQQSCVPEADQCWCRGSGWVVSDWDSLHECPYHYEGQPNNEDPGWVWDQWMDNAHGNEQFMVIQEECNNYEETWAWHARCLGRDLEDILF